MEQVKGIHTDVLVTGGSLEGCIAAMELAKAGKEVLLTEKKGSLGGAASNGLEVFLSCKDLTDERAKKYGEEILEKAGRSEGLTGPLFHDQKCKPALAEMLKREGVTALTHIFPFAVSQKDGEILCMAECKTGTLEIHAEILIDAQPFGDCAGQYLAEWDSRKEEYPIKTKEGSLQAAGAVKWNGICANGLKEALEPGYEEGEDFLAGKLHIGYVWEKNGITYGGGSVSCYHSKKFGETIFTKLPVRLPNTSVFTLSEAEAGLRGYAYRLRDRLRTSQKGFEKAAIIHVGSEMNLYGIRIWKRNQTGRLFVMNIEEYSNEKAIMTGLSVADRAAGFLEE